MNRRDLFEPCKTLGRLNHANNFLPTVTLLILWQGWSTRLKRKLEFRRTLKIDITSRIDFLSPVSTTATNKLNSVSLIKIHKMPLELVIEAPKKEDFTPLTEHQSQTPVTFFGSRPVLHHYSPEAKLAVRKNEYEQHDILRQIHTSSDADSEDVILNVDVWITSR
jgi:hypothetical protein